MSGGDGEPAQQRPRNSESVTTPEAVADRLHSWKEIAVYLNRDVRTVRRWEKNQGLPVHRHLHQKSASVYAYRSELDLWWEDERKRLADANGGGESETAPSLPPAPSPRTRARLLWIAAAGLAILSLAVLGILLGRRIASNPPPASGRVMLAVLPFQNLTGDATQEYVSDGFTEEMITELGGLRSANLGVIARTSSMVYKNSNKPVSQIGRELGVQYVLEGSVRRWGDRVRVTAQLIQTRDQTHLWAQDFESDRSDVLRLQSEITRAIADQIRLTLPGHEAELGHGQPLDPQVHELCLLGLYQANQRNEAGLTKAIGYFQQAIAKDPRYAPAHAGLAEAYLVSAFYSRGSAKELYELARSSAQRAVDLNGGTFQAHATLGLVKSSYLEPGGEAEFQRALDLNPSYATGHHWYAFELWRSGRHEDALAELERARELDPVSPIIYTDDAVFHLSAGQDEEAVRLLHRALDLDPLFSEAHRTLAIAYARQKRFPAALDEARAALRQNSNNDGAEATLAYVEAENGNRAAAETTLRQLQARHAPPFLQAWIYVGLGKNADAVTSLEEEYRSRSPLMLAIAVEPVFVPLQQDPGFRDLLRHISTGR